jgi:hypothetical protein
MATTRTGHTGKSIRPPGGYPVERVYRAVAKAISDEAKAKGISREVVLEQHFPGALQSAPARSVPRRNGSTARTTALIHAPRS